MLTKAQSYPAVDVTVQNQGLVVNAANINPPTIRLSAFNANMEFLDDKLQEIDQLGGTTHFVDPDKVFCMEQPFTSSSVLPAEILLTDDFTDSVALGWNQAKVGLVGPDTTLKQTVEHFRRRLFGLGGDQLTIDQKQETDSASTQLDANYLAMRFSPRFRALNSVSVRLSKVGSPTLGPVLEIIEDDGTNQPLGTILRSISKDKDAITGSAGWHSFKISEELNTALDYWIVLVRTGTPTDTFAWHKDASSSFVNGFSPDGASWTITPSSFGFAFRQYTINPILAVFSDNTNLNTIKLPREEVIRKPTITETPVMWQLLRQECETICKRKDIFSAPVYAPDTILIPGQKVRVRKQSSGFIIDEEYIIGNITYTFNAEEATGIIWYNIDGVRYATL